MFEVALLYPDKQQGAAKRYGMPQDMGKDLNLSVILRAMAKEDEEIFTNCQRVLLCPVTDEKMLLSASRWLSYAVSHPAILRGNVPYRERGDAGNSQIHIEKDKQ